jgi:uncharacterized membrane protein YfcA
LLALTSAEVVLSVLQILLLTVAGFAAGAINALAGGGSFFSFAALVATGLPALDANATSAAALAPSNVAILLGYRSEVREHSRHMLLFSLIGAVGGAIGAFGLIWVGDDGFRPLVPWLLLTATLLFAFSEKIRAFIAPWAQGKSLPAAISAYVVMTLVSIYGGFFGAGMGIMMLAALAILESADYHKANAIKNIVATVIQAISAGILIAGGLVHWQQGFVAMGASIVGGYVGVHFARRIPPKIIRAVVVAAGAGLTVIFFLK